MNMTRQSNIKSGSAQALRSQINAVRIIVSLFAISLMTGCDQGSIPVDQQPKPDPAANMPMDTRKAGVGVGAKGASLRDSSISARLVSGKARAFFDVKEKLVFETTIPYALNLYKASDSFGRGPKTHEEFMDKIIKANNIVLPELPEGMRYRYRPDDGDQEGELWVENIAEMDAQAK
jgi:hypothetical protein